MCAWESGGQSTLSRSPTWMENRVRRSFPPSRAASRQTRHVQKAHGMPSAAAVPQKMMRTGQTFLYFAATCGPVAFIASAMTFARSGAGSSFRGVTACFFAFRSTSTPDVFSTVASNS